MFRTFITAAAVAVLPVAALAQSFSAKDVEAHFKQAPELNCPTGQECLVKPIARGVCVGTASKCGSDTTTTARIEPTAFDLLITFEIGSDRLSDQARLNLTEFARALNGDALRNVQFNVDGHTDASGSDAFNLSLSERRAASVVSFLKGQGISPARLEATGHGESSPRDADPFAAINRRVEATVRLR